MGDVTEFRRRDEKETDAIIPQNCPCRCSSCGHTWTEAEPADVDGILCPNCKTHKGTMSAFINPPKGWASWRCSCGSFVFECWMDENGVAGLFCIGCAKPVRFP